VLFPSPKAIRENGNDNFKLKPVGTGPFKFVELVERDRMVMDRNSDYWDGAPKLERLVIRPLAEPATRMSALQSGEVQWAEIPPPDSLQDLKAKGMQVFLNEYPHVWPYVFNVKEKPWDDVRVRQAANYAIDREGMVEHLLHGVGSPATGPVYPEHPWYPKGATEYKYDPEKAKQLLAEAGYPEGFKTKIVIPSSGSGNMWPIEMGEYIQQNLRDVGIQVDFEVIEWNTMRTQYRQGFTPGVGAYNYAWTMASPDFVEQFYLSSMMPPKGLNPGGYNNPEVDRLLTQARETFDETERDNLIREAFMYVQNEAPWLFVVHDNNLRVMAPSVKGFVQPQAWYVDLTKIWVE
jgi:peptide/nickel transport system substrate-binding protein